MVSIYRSSFKKNTVEIIELHQKPIMDAEFLVEGVGQMFWSPFIEGRDKILLLGEALKFGVILQRLALNLLKIWKIMKKNLEKIFPKFFLFLTHAVGHNKNSYI